VVWKVFEDSGMAVDLFVSVDLGTLEGTRVRGLDIKGRSKVNIIFRCFSSISKKQRPCRTDWWIFET
jgi:hypothetical protein